MTSDTSDLETPARSATSRIVGRRGEPATGSAMAGLPTHRGTTPAVPRTPPIHRGTTPAVPRTPPIHRGTTPAVPRTPPIHRGTTPAVPRTPPGPILPTRLSRGEPAGWRRRAG